VNNFNKIFSAIKEYCNDTDTIYKGDCFSVIARKTDIPVENLEAYLNILKDLGLIKYSWADRKIQLTLGGTMKDKLFQ